MLRRQNRARNYSAHPETKENDISFNGKLKQNSSFITITKSNTPSRQTRYPTSARNVAVFQHDPNFSKILPKDISLDKERLVEENSALKLKASECMDENQILKSRLLQLLQEQNLESSEKVPKMKKKIRELQEKFSAKEAEVVGLKTNIRSSKLLERENEIMSYINEARRLKYLLEGLLEHPGSMNAEEYSQRNFEIGIEFQALKKENLELSQAIVQANHSLDSLNAKMSKFIKKTRKTNFKKILKELKSEYEYLQSTLTADTETFQNKENDIIERIRKERIIGAEILQKLERLESRSHELTIISKEMKSKLNLSKSRVIGAKRNYSLLVVAESSSPLKLENPPRLFVKINQILKKKKMLISVFLSLLDKNNTGLLSIDNFISSMKDFGKKIKRKYIQQVMDSVGATLSYIPLRLLENLFEKYRYANDNYVSSSDEDAKIMKKSSDIRQSRPQSPNKVQAAIPRPESENIPAPTKEEPLKLVPIAVEQVGSRKNSAEIKASQIKDDKTKIIQTSKEESNAKNDALGFVKTPLKEEPEIKVTQKVRDTQHTPPLSRAMPPKALEIIEEVIDEKRGTIIEEDSESEKENKIEKTELDSDKERDITLEESKEFNYVEEVPGFKNGDKEEQDYIEEENFENSLNKEEIQDKDEICDEMEYSKDPNFVEESKGYEDDFKKSLSDKEEPGLSENEYSKDQNFLEDEIVSENEYKDEVYEEDHNGKHLEQSKDQSYAEDYENFDSKEQSYAEKDGEHKGKLNREQSIIDEDKIYENEFEESYKESFERSNSIEEAIHENINPETELHFVEYGIKLGK